MRIYIAITFFVMVLTEAWAGGSELFPLHRLKLGMKVQQFIAIYPKAKQAMIKKDKSGSIIEGIALCKIKNGKFWDSALVKIKDSQIESWSYVLTKNFNRARKNIGEIFKALKQDLGKDVKKKVCLQLLKQGKVRSPAFVWKRDDHFVVFSHSPVRMYKKGEIFLCRLTIAPTKKSVYKLLDFVDDKKENDLELFQEVLNEKFQPESK